MNVQKQMQELFGHSCTAYCYSYLADPIDDIKKLTRDVLNGWYNGAIEDDGYVAFPVKYLKGLGFDCIDIAKVPLSKIKDLPDDNNYVVEYSYNNGSHFVVANRQKGVIFDPAGESNSVKYGKIVSYRKVIV